jgi:cytochrome b561
MKKLSECLQGAFIVILVSPFILAWIPAIQTILTENLSAQYLDSLFSSFRQLSVTLGATVLIVSSITIALGYASIQWPIAGKITASALDAIESVPAILIALFCYAPVSGYMAGHSGSSSSFVSLMVFIFAAALTTLPEAVRGITLPLGDLYYRKYSLSFRSYGFTRSRILAVLLGTRMMKDAFRRTCAGILLKTLVLDCSFGFIIQLGFGSYGTPAHASPGALIAANRDALFAGGDPRLFWIPVIPLVMISMAFLIMFDNEKEKEI